MARVSPLGRPVFLPAILALCLLAPLQLWCSCTGSSPTWTSTPDQSSVSSCIAGASRNDTITISAGSATWTSSVTVTKGVRIVATGTVTLTQSSNFPFFVSSPDSTAITNGETIKIAGITFNANSVGTIMLNLNGADGITATQPYCCYIIYGNTFKNQAAGTSDGVITAANANNNGQIRGVISTNTFDRDDIILRIFSNNDEAESNNSAFAVYPGGTTLGTSDNLFFENNTIKWSSAYTGGNPGWTETGQGGRLVQRYNTWNFANVTGASELNDIHGSQNWNGSPGSGQTSTMISERYGNIYTNFGGYRALNFRGGLGMVFNNLLTVPGSAPSWQVYGQSGGASCPSDINPSPTNYNPLIYVYSFNNTANGTEMPLTNGYGGTFGCTITENNGAAYGTKGGTSQGAWWNYNASCTASSCTAGIGRGTTAPTGTCTKGTGFWVSSTPTPTTSSSVIQSSSFYVCTATNTWTSWYTPYTYPHPLTVTYALSTATAGTGSGTVTGCAGSYAAGASYSCTVSPAAGSSITSVSGCSGSGTTTYTGSMPASNCVVTATFAATAATPTFSPGAGSYGPAQTVTISSTTSGATILYTTDGSTPACPSTGTTYTTPITVSTSETVKAIACASGYTDSAVGSAAYVINGAVATPTFSPVAGTYTSAQTVTISSSTAGATIRYTTTGTAPTCSTGTVYSSPVSVPSSLTLKAIGCKTAYVDSTVGSAAYVINIPTQVTITGTVTITGGATFQ